MEPVAKAARGRKRQPARKVSRQEEQVDIVKQTEVEEESRAVPKPTISQRLTKSLKQLSQLGAEPKPEEGEEVDQALQEAAPAPLIAEDQLQPVFCSPSEDDVKCHPRKLNFSMVPHISLIYRVAGAAAVLVVVLCMCHWYIGRLTSQNVRLLQRQIEAAQTAGLEHEKSLVDLQQFQAAMHGQLISIAASVESLQSAVGSSSNTTTEEALAAMRSWLNELRNSVNFQQVLLKRIQEQQGSWNKGYDIEESVELAGGGQNNTNQQISMRMSSKELKHAVSSLVEAEVQKALELFEADKTGLVDYAQASIGGCVLAHSDLLYTPSHGGFLGHLTSFMQSQKLHPEATELLLSPKIVLGKCLPLSGSSGYIDILLGDPILPTAFSYEHVPASVALDARSAPRHLTLYALESPVKGDMSGNGGGSSMGQSSRGLHTGTVPSISGDLKHIRGISGEEKNSKHNAGKEGTMGNASAGNSDSSGDLGGSVPGMRLLGELRYDVRHGRPVQTAHFTGPSGQGLVSRVRVEVQGNHGHPQYTCMYRIRVHGDREVLSQAVAAAQVQSFA